MNFVKILINIERLQKRNMPYALVSSASELRARLQRRRARAAVCSAHVECKDMSTYHYRHTRVFCTDNAKLLDTPSALYPARAPITPTGICIYSSSSC